MRNFAVICLAILVVLLGYETWETRQTSLELRAQHKLMVEQHRTLLLQLQRIEGAVVEAGRTPVVRWEYRIESPADLLFETSMAKYGSEGWELVAARRATSSYGPASYEMIFKRPRR